MFATIRLFVFFCFVPLFSAFCIVIPSAWAAEVKPVSVKASTVHPASSAGKYVPEQLLDGNPATPWVAAPGRGMNEWVEFDFGKEVTLSAIEFRNGYQKSDKSYTGNSRVQWASLNIEGKRSDHVFDLKDVKDWQRVTLPDVKVKVLRLNVESIFKGSSSREVALSEVRFHSGNLPARKVEKGKSPAENLSKEHQEFFAKLEKFTDADAALANLEKRVAGEFGEVHPKDKEYLQGAIDVCKAMKKGLASYNNVDIHDAFNGAFPHNGPMDNNSDINIALLATYAANPYFDIRWTSLNAFEGRIKAVVSKMQSFSQFVADFKTYLPPQNALEAIHYADCATALAKESLMYAGYSGSRELTDSLLAFERDLVAGVLKDASPNGRGGIELYKGWSAGMTIGDAYARIRRDKLAYDLSYLGGDNFRVPVDGATGKILYISRPYDPQSGRYDLSGSIQLNDYDYPDRTPQKTPQGRKIPMQGVVVGGIFMLPLADDVVLHFTQGHGLFSVTKRMRNTNEFKLADALAGKYGPSTHKTPNKAFHYKNLTGDLYIFQATHQTVHYAERTMIDRLFAVWAEWKDKSEGGAEKKIEDDI